MQPLVRAFATQTSAARARARDPLRLSYTIFADKNPWMRGVQNLAADVAADRKPVAANNPFLALQTLVSNQILASLDSYRAMRDHFAEQTFFAFYGSPMVQACLGISPDSVVRPSPDLSPEKLAARRLQGDACAANLRAGGFDEALTRAVLYVVSAEGALDQRSAFALNVARKQLMHLSIAAFKAMIRDQFYVLQLERNRAIDVLPTMVPEAGGRRMLLEQTNTIVSAGGSLVPAERERLEHLSKVLEDAAKGAAKAAKPNHQPVGPVP